MATASRPPPQQSEEQYIPLPLHFGLTADQQQACNGCHPPTPFTNNSNNNNNKRNKMPGEQAAAAGGVLSAAVLPMDNRKRKRSSKLKGKVDSSSSEHVHICEKHRDGQTVIGARFVVSVDGKLVMQLATAAHPKAHPQDVSIQWLSPNVPGDEIGQYCDAWLRTWLQFCQSGGGVHRDRMRQSMLQSAVPLRDPVSNVCEFILTRDTKSSNASLEQHKLPLSASSQPKSGWLLWSSHLVQINDVAVSTTEIQAFRTELALSNAILLTVDDVQRYTLPSETTQASLSKKNTEEDKNAGEVNNFPDTWATLDENRVVRLIVDVRFGLQFTLWHEDLPGAVFFDAHQAQLCPFLLRCVTLFVTVCNHTDILSGDPRWISGELYMEALATRDAAGFVVDELARLYHLFYIRDAPGIFASDMLRALLLHHEHKDDLRHHTSTCALSDPKLLDSVVVVPFQRLKSSSTHTLSSQETAAAAAEPRGKTRKGRVARSSPLSLPTPNAPSDDLRHTPYNPAAAAPQLRETPQLRAAPLVVHPYARHMLTNRLYHHESTHQAPRTIPRPLPSLVGDTTSSVSDTKSMGVATLGHITRTVQQLRVENNPPNANAKSVQPPTRPTTNVTTTPQFPCLVALQEFAHNLTPSLVVPPLRDMDHSNTTTFWPDSPRYSGGDSNSFSGIVEASGFVSAASVV